MQNTFPFSSNLSNPSDGLEDLLFTLPDYVQEHCSCCGCFLDDDEIESRQEFCSDCNSELDSYD